MLSNDSTNNSTNNSTEPQASAPSGAKAGAAKDDVAPMNPRSHVEVAAGGSGPTNDPAASDTRPPVTTGYDLLADV